MRCWRGVALLLCLVVVGGPVLALEPSLDSLETGERGRVATVVDGDTVMLEGVGGGFTWGAVLLDF